MRVGIIGTGAVSVRHLEALRAVAGVEVCAHLGTSEAKADAAAARWGGAPFADLDAFVRQGRPDGVVIAVPPNAHGAIERRLIEDGIPFLVDKPLAADLATAEAIASRLAERRLVAAAGYQWRALDALAQVRATLAVGPPRLIIGEFLVGTPPSPWWVRQAASGGQFVEQTCHLVDLARLLAGEAVVDSALDHLFTRPAYPQADIAGACVATMRFAGGAIGVFLAACTLPESTTHAVRLRLICDGGHVLLTLAGATIVDAEGTRDLPATSDPYETQARAFITAVKTDNPQAVLCRYDDALATHRLCCEVARRALEARPQP